MITKNFQHKLDLFIDKTILWAIPTWLKPNFFSYLRILLVPVIYVLLERHNLRFAFVLFIIAVSTDFIDGALARTRNQITDLGKVLDPIADKMVILTVLLFIGFEFLIVKLFTVFILFEIVANFSVALFAKYLGKPIGSNVYGKIKMVFQSISVTLFLIGLILKNSDIILASEALLTVAIVFALLAGLEQIKRYIERHFNNKKEAV